MRKNMHVSIVLHPLFFFRHRLLPEPSRRPPSLVPLSALQCPPLLGVDHVRGLRLACPVRRRGLGRRDADVLACRGLVLAVASFNWSWVALACGCTWPAWPWPDQGGAAAAGGGVPGGGRPAAAAADGKAEEPQFLVLE